MTVAATIALPYEHVEQATAGLLARLRQKLLTVVVHQMPDWAIFTVPGPKEFTDLRGRSCTSTGRPWDQRPVRPSQLGRLQKP